MRKWYILSLSDCSYLRSPSRRQTLIPLSFTLKFVLSRWYREISIVQIGSIYSPASTKTDFPQPLSRRPRSSRVLHNHLFECKIFLPRSKLSRGVEFSIDRSDKCFVLRSRVEISLRFLFVERSSFRCFPRAQKNPDRLAQGLGARERRVSRPRTRSLASESDGLLGMLRMLYDKLYLCRAVLRWFETGVTAKEAAYSSGTPQCTPAASGSLGGHRSRPRSGGHPDMVYTQERQTSRAFFFFSTKFTYVNREQARAANEGVKREREARARAWSRPYVYVLARETLNQRDTECWSCPVGTADVPCTDESCFPFRCARERCGNIGSYDKSRRT